MNNQQTQLLSFFVLVVSIALFIRHRQQEYEGDYNISGSYDNVSAVKHDVTKVFWTEMFPILVYGLSGNDKFYNPNNFLDSKLGEIIVLFTGYFIYYELIQPYMVNRTPLW
jgi:hypothetical protein